ncbi:MAG: DUF1295 domain-containing protein [Wenzhouxiangellaceae bacterium]
MLISHHSLFMLALCVLVMLLVWELQRRTRNAGWVDVAWTFLIGIQALYYGVVGAGAVSARWAAAGLALVWSLRLGWYLARRVAGEDEDGRYQALRQHWQGREQLRFFGFFQAQALVAWLLPLAIYAVAEHSHQPGPMLYAGIALGLLAIAGESLADRQLARHRRQHPGVTCRSGLWRYSRHPNYFFEWLHWCAYPLMAVGSAAQWWVWLAPAVMLMFLYRVTGIPYTEKQALKSRGDDYRRYQQETNAFFPWFPQDADSTAS